MPQSNEIIGSLFWKAGERVMVQGVGLIVQIILARLLLPEDFASLAIINAIVNFLGLFVQAGLSTAVVQKKNLTKMDLSTLVTISLVVAFVLYLGLFFFAPAINHYYHVGNLIWPIRVMGLSLFLYSFNSIQTGILSREMMFRTMFFRSLLATPLSAIVGILLAYKGFGVWALIAYSMTNILAIVLFMGLIPELRLNIGFSLQSVKELYSFCIKILFTNLISTSGDTIRTMTIGKVYKPTQLAYYDRAYSYSSLVTQVVNMTLSSVLLPVFSRNQDDLFKLKFMARQSVGVSSFVMIPALVYVAIMSKPLVVLILGDKWVSCAPFLALFCILRIPGIITSIDKQVYYALGKSQWALYYEAGLLVVNIISLVLMMPHGVFAIAIGYTIVEFVGNFILCILSSHIYHYSLFERLCDLYKVVLLTLFIVLSVLLVGVFITGMWNKLILMTFIYLLLYLSYIFFSKDVNAVFLRSKVLGLFCK